MLQGFTIKDRKSHEAIIFTASPVVMLGQAGGRLVGTTTRQWMIVTGPTMVPATVAYLDPLPEGWPQECGKGEG